MSCLNCLASDTLLYEWSLELDQPTNVVRRFDWSFSTTGNATRNLVVDPTPLIDAELVVVESYKFNGEGNCHYPDNICPHLHTLAHSLPTL